METNGSKMYLIYAVRDCGPFSLMIKSPDEPSIEEQGSLEVVLIGLDQDLGTALSKAKENALHEGLSRVVREIEEALQKLPQS